MARRTVPPACSSRRAPTALLLVALLLLPAGAFAHGALLSGTIPKAKPTPAAYAAFDGAMLAFVEERGVTAATPAVSRNGAVLWSQGYGYAAPGEGEVAPIADPHAPMRIASVTKPLTLAVVKHLISDGTLRRSDPVFYLSAGLSSTTRTLMPHPQRARTHR